MFLCTSMVLKVAFAGLARDCSVCIQTSEFEADLYLDFSLHQD